MYEIVLTRRALKDLKALDASLKKRIGKQLQKAAADPLALSRKLTNPQIGTYRLRVGDYRVIFDLQDHQMVILRVGHRREIYNF